MDIESRNAENTLNYTSLSTTNETTLPDVIYTNLRATSDNLNQTENAPIFMFCCAISLAAVSGFLRSGFILKLLTMIVTLVCQIVVLGFSDLYEVFNLYHRNA